MPIRIHETELTRDRPYRPNVSPSTVLVVDDSVFDHHVIDRAAEARGGAARHLRHGGSRGPGAVEHESPDLILTDLIMPDMDGLELVQQVRGRLPPIP